jgi:hypothetical protein
LLCFGCGCTYALLGGLNPAKQCYNAKFTWSSWVTFFFSCQKKGASEKIASNLSKVGLLMCMRYLGAFLA